jgi:hypothetical protein
LASCAKNWRSFFDLAGSKCLDGAVFLFSTMKLETFFSVKDVRSRFHPSRCARWIKDTFRTGEFGPVLRDSSGWLISESALLEYQRRHAVVPAAELPVRSSQRSSQRSNLVQFKKVAGHE